MDLQMSEMDGFAATKCIRENERTTQKHMPIIAMTPNAMSGDKERCLAAGMDAYISKPLHPKYLFSPSKIPFPAQSSLPSNDLIGADLQIGFPFSVTVPGCRRRTPGSPRAAKGSLPCLVNILFTKSPTRPKVLVTEMSAKQR